MGEYALYKGKEVKIGTCNSMYYLRWEQRKSVVHQPGNVNPVTQANVLWFRAPRKREDGIEPGMFDFQGWCGVEPIRFYIKNECKQFYREVEELAKQERGLVSVRAEKIGVTCKVPCYHGFTTELPEGMCYNGFNPNTLGIAGLGVREGGAVALIGCVACGDTFMIVDLEELVRNCAPFADEREDWEYALKQMMEIEAEQWLDYERSVRHG